MNTDHSQARARQCLYVHEQVENIAKSSSNAGIYGKIIFPNRLRQTELALLRALSE